MPSVTDVDTGAASATDPTVDAGSFAGSDCGFVGSALRALEFPSVESVVFDSVPLERTLDAFFFGFFAEVTSSDLSVPAFLPFVTAVVVDFLLSPEPSTSLCTTVPEPLSVSPSCSPSASFDAEDWDDSEESGDDGFASAGADDDESVVESDVSAHADPGAVATATPTPNATAKPPTRPTYLA
ncbi:hypothetical protein ACGFK1_23515 [Mycobacterium sp. NPDC048908]|uniref:hypothetical protein n=1 Tax=Mycobacterium sp. NPDC048908 TaxID=3364292 RepID=UPI0037123253